MRIKDIVGFKGQIAFDTTKPDGTPKKLLDVSKLFMAGAQRWDWRKELGMVSCEW